MTLKMIDLFAGIGGFHYAFHNLEVETVYASEWDKFARQTYQTNFETISPQLFWNNNFGEDITQVEPNTIPDFNIICGGFPCQPFSYAGKREGFEDTRGTLFFNIAEIIKTKQPEAFLLENVRGLLTHDGTKTFNTIRKTLTEKLGYSFHHKIVKGTDFNTPQHRPRLYLVGFREDITDTFTYPTPIPLTTTLESVLGGKVTTPSGGERKIGFTLRVGGRKSGVHDRRNWDTYIVDGKEHYLTIDEAKTLQGFPDWFTFPVSETQAFKQLGNSIVVPVAQAIGTNILEVLKKNKIK